MTEIHGVVMPVSLHSVIFTDIQEFSKANINIALKKTLFTSAFVMIAMKLLAYATTRTFGI